MTISLKITFCSNEDIQEKLTINDSCSFMLKNWGKFCNLKEEWTSSKCMLFNSKLYNQDLQYSARKGQAQNPTSPVSNSKL